MAGTHDGWQQGTPLAIAGIADAIDLAWGLHEQFRHAHAAAVVDHTGAVLDLTVFTAEQSQMGTAVQWAVARVQDDPTVTGVVLFSIGQGDVGTAKEDDLFAFRRARSLLDDLGVVLHDWVQSDDEHLRSLNETAGLVARWPGDEAA